MSKKLRLLIVEDNKDDAVLLLRELRRGGYEAISVRVDTPETMREALTQRWDAVVADYSLPHFSGTEAFSIAREANIDLPFIIVTGAIGEDRAVELMKLGVHDFITKGNLSRLVPAIERAISEANERKRRREAERALRDSEEYFRSLIENSTDIIAVLGPDQCFRYLSPSVERTLGYTTEELVSKSVMDFVHPEDKPYLEHGLAEEIRTVGATETMEFRFRHKDGSWHFFEAVGKTSRDPSGEMTMILNARDISERKKAEETAFQLASIVESSDDAIIGEGLDGIITTWNRGAQKIFGFTAEEMTGESIFSIVPESHHNEWRQLLQSVRRGKSFDHYETVRVRKDSRLIDVSLTISPTWDSHGQINGTSVIARDTTESKQAQEQIQRQLQRLAALRKIDMAITSSLDLRVTMNVILDQVTAQLSIDAAAALHFNPHTQTLDYTLSRGFRTDALQYSHVHLGEGYAGRAAVAREIIDVPDLRLATGEFARSHSFAGEGFVAYLAVPLIAKSQVKGVLELFHRSPLEITDEWRDFLDALGNQAAIAIDNAAMFNDLQRSNLELTMAYDTTLEGWSRAIDLRDKETEGHTQRVTEVTLRVARAFGFTDVEMGHIRRGSLLHDCGKLGIPDNILLKAGPLTSEEEAIMHKHAEYAYRLLAPIQFLRPALDIPYCHHEWWDGTGYPRGLKGEEIPLPARIFAVADVWDALRSDRPYRKAWPDERVCEHIRSQAATHFDPRVVDVFLRMFCPKKFVCGETQRDFAHALTGQAG